MLKLSYGPSAVPLLDEYRTAFSAHGYDAQFVADGRLTDPLRVLAYRRPGMTGYVFSPYPALAANSNLAPAEAVAILFDGRLTDPAKMKDAWHGQPGGFYRLCLHTAELLEAGVDFHDAAHRAWEETNHFHVLADHLYDRLAEQTGAYMAAYHGYHMLKALLDAGLQVHYAGARAYGGLYRHPNLVITKGPCSAQILLVPQPTPLYGASERMLSAMGGGTVVVTNTNAFLAEHFTDADCIVYNGPSVSGCFAERIAQLRQDPDALAAIGASARGKIAHRHMPFHRVADIVTALEVSGHTEVSLYE